MEQDYYQYLIDGENAGNRFILGMPSSRPLGSAGLHLGDRAGSSIEFKDHREYQAGDDLRRIDWSAYARSDRLIVKLYREEVTPHVDLIIDGSKSMTIGGKAQSALGIAAVFATAAANAGFSHSAWLARELIERVPNSGERPMYWHLPALDYPGNISDSLSRHHPHLRRQGIRALVSDLLWLGEPAPLLKQIAKDASSVVVAQVLARQDLEPVERGNLRLEDSETGSVREVFVDSPALDRYKWALRRHQENWSAACKQIGAVFTTLVAEDTLVDWRLEELVSAQILRVI